MFASPHSVNTTPQVVTGGISSPTENIIQTKPLSGPNSTNNLDSAPKHKSTNAAPCTSSRSIKCNDCVNTHLTLSPDILAT